MLRSYNFLLAVQTGLPFYTQVAVSKGALEGLTTALAAEYAPKIIVNCSPPTLTDTPLAVSLLNTEKKGRPIPCNIRKKSKPKSGRDIHL